MHYTSHPHQTPPLDPDAYSRATDAAIARETAHARAEIHLLGAVCPIGRWGIALARAEGVCPTDMTHDDTIAVWAALTVADADGRIADREATYLLARHALIIAGHWDETDERSYVAGMIRSPRALARIFAGMVAADAERLAPVLARRLAALREGRAAA